MQIKQLSVECAKLVERFGRDINALETCVYETKKAVVFSVETNLSKIEFVYTVRKSMFCPQSTLYTRIYPLKTADVFFHLYELMDKDDFRCTYFPYIENPDRLTACFHVLTDIMNQYLPQVEETVLDSDRFAALKRKKQEEMALLLNIKETDIPADAASAALFWQNAYAMFESYVQLARFTTFDGYMAFLIGDIASAKTLYQTFMDKSTALEYEQRLYAFLCSGKELDDTVLPAECASVLEAKPYASGKKDGMLLLKSFGVMYLFFAVIWIGLALVIELTRAKGAVFFPFGWYIMPPILAILPALFGAVSQRRRFIKWFSKKEATQTLHFDDILNSNAVNRLAHTVFAITVVIGLFFAVIFPLAAPVFYSDHMLYDDAANFPFLNRVTYQYQDIDRIFHIAARYNDFGDLIERGSYILCFKDGSVIDLDGSISERDTVDHILPMLTPYVDQIEYKNSDRDLPIPIQLSMHL